MNMESKLKYGETFDTDVLRQIERMDCSEARSQCLTMIEGTSTRASRKQALIRDIQAAPNSRELSRIMWNVMLAGEGLSTTNSAWQRTYK